MRGTGMALLALMLGIPAHAHPPLRDPFARPAPPAAGGPAGAAIESPPQAPKPRLRAILFARGLALADIDGQMLREGDWFNDWRVARIEERRVRLKRRADDLVLQLDGEKER